MVDGAITLAADVLPHLSRGSQCKHQPPGVVREYTWVGGDCHEHHYAPATPGTRMIDARWLTSEAAAVYGGVSPLGVLTEWDISECLRRRALPANNINAELFEHRTTLVPQEVWAASQIHFAVGAHGSLIGRLISGGWLTSDGKVDALWEELRQALARYGRPARVLVADRQTRVSRTIEVLG